MNIPIVQGIDVVGNSGGKQQQGNYSQFSDGYTGGYSAPNTTQGQQQQYAPNDTFNGVKGEQQPKKFQDAIWAVAFIMHLIIMSFFMVGMSGSNNGEGSDYSGVVYVVSVCGVVAFGLVTVALGFMMQFATEIVKFSLFFSLGSSLAVGIIGAMMGQMIMCILGVLSFTIGCCYTYMVWGRIPFAAANLRTGLSAVKSNLGIVVVAYFFLALAFGWSVWWMVTAGSALRSVGQTAVFFFLLSYYWVHQVLQNTVHVTTAGVVGTWWFAPLEASGFWSSSVRDSFVRSTTFSFGSICFGSFLVAFVQALRQMQRIARDNDDCSMVACIIDCILGCIQGIIEYLNKWAYVYVGLYGYSYLDAARNVIGLFQSKGWSVIITDDMMENVLFMVSVAIGLFTGLVGLILGKMDENAFSEFSELGIEDTGIVGFVMGFLVGFLFASIMMGVVGSAVNTVIVLFAEAPAELQENHPELSNEMREAWRCAWPEQCANV